MKVGGQLHSPMTLPMGKRRSIALRLLNGRLRASGKTKPCLGADVIRTTSNPQPSHYTNKSILTRILTDNVNLLSACQQYGGIMAVLI